MLSFILLILYHLNCVDGSTYLSNLAAGNNSLGYIHCTETITGGWVRIPLRLTGKHRIALHTEHYEIERDLLVMEIDELPNSMAWTELNPAYGTVTTSKRLRVRLQANRLMLKDGDQLSVNIVDVKDMVFPSSYTYMDSSGNPEIEPGSWFFEVSLVPPMGPRSDDRLFSLPNIGYIEFVLSEEEIQQQRRFMNVMPDPELSAASLLIDQEHLNLPLVSSFGEPQKSKQPDIPQMLCVWGTDHMDGQKSIWLQQMRHLDKAKFAFTYVLTGGGLGDPPPDGVSVVQVDFDGTRVTLREDGMAMKVNALGHVRIYLSPIESLPIQVEDFVVAPEDGGSSLAAVWDGSALMVAAYILDRMESAGGKLEQVSPLWCQDWLRVAMSRLRALSCDTIIYGNNRGDNSDRLLVTLAKYIGVPSVGELLNLFVEVMPDVIVAPSHYAMEHPSVKDAVNKRRAVETSAAESSLPAVVVVSPGIDFHLFRRPIKVEALKPQRSITIGFIGRLAIEKNPGLFVLAAQVLLQKCPFCRFLIVGDGQLRQNLETLTRALDIKWAVNFTGWVSEAQLPALLESVDIVVNPSLRAWSETFCIANIQAMAMGVPLVTFGVGGVGEYIVPPASVNIKQESAAGGKQGQAAFTISPNCMLVNVASPQAVADAVEVLVRNKSLRIRLGAAGRMSIERVFAVPRQMKQYEELYSQILHL